MLIDSHCHLDKLDTSHYENGFAGLVEATQAAGIDEMLCIGVNTEAFPKMLSLIEDYSFIHASAGIHPLGIDAPKQGINWSLLAQQAAHSRVIAVGETGLDYHYQPETKPTQQHAFIEHTRIAKEVSKPLIVHTRAACDDTVSILKAHADLSISGVIHCFTEDWDMAKRCLDLGFYISISGIVTFNNAKQLRDVVRQLPPDRLLVETDAPYLAPVPFRGQQNEPKHVQSVAQCVADLQGISVAKLSDTTSENFYRLFGLG